MTERRTEVLRGGCHCGRVAFEVDGPLAGVTECNCSICTKKGFLHWIVSPERFRLLSPPDAVATYRFHTGIARHHFCPVCGIHSYYVPRSDPDKIDVNVRCLEGVDLGAIVVTRFDGRHWEEAQRRRGAAGA